MVPLASIDPWVAAIFLFLGGCALIGRRSYFHRQFLSRLEAEGRSISWREVLPHLHAGEGSLIIKRTNMDGRIWWTDQHISQDDAIAAIVSYAKLLTSC